MKKAVIYARVRDSYNSQEVIKRQKTICQQLANEKSLTIVGYYIDIEKLGTPTNRVALSQMIDDSLTATWDTVITYSSDRICRNIKQFMIIEETLEKRGKSLLIVTSPDHQFYRKLIRELNRIKNQIRKKEKEIK